MNDQPQLYRLRIAELDALLDAHLSAGSLDEGNASAFDRLVDAWLEEELARLDLAHDQRAREVATARQHRLAAEARAAEERDLARRRDEDHRLARLQHQEESEQRRARITEAKRARRACRLARAAERLDQAAARLQHAELRLIGDLLTTPPDRAAGDVPHRDEPDLTDRVA